MRPFPSTIGELLLALEETFPEAEPRPGDQVDKIFYAAGQRSVLKYVKRWREDATKPRAAVPARGAGRAVK